LGPGQQQSFEIGYINYPAAKRIFFLIITAYNNKPVVTILFNQGLIKKYAFIVQVGKRLI